MTLILLDGLEDTSSGVATSSTIVAGRNGNALSLVSGNTHTYTIPASQESDTVTVGAAFKMSSVATQNIFFRLLSDAAGTTHVTVQINTDGSLSVLRGTAAVLIATVAGLIAANTWYYLELQTKLHDTTGTATLRVNGVVVATGTGLDTKNLGTKTTFDTVRLGSVATVTTLWDDFYLMAGTGDTPLGDIVIETLYPNGNGNANQWLGSDGDSTNNYLLVDEAVADPADYVADSVSGHQDMYALTNLVATTGTVLGVCHQAYMAKTDAVNTRQAKIVNRRSTDTKSGTLTLATTYAGLHYVLTQDPETSAAWTIANVNNLQSGVEVV